MKFNAFLTGQKELIDSLKRMDKDAKKKIVEKPFSKQADKIKSKAEREVPEVSGDLKKSLKIRRTSQTERGKFATKRINASAPYAFAVHFGTKAGSKSAKKIGVRQPQPFLFEFVEDNEDKILDTMTREIGEELEKSFNK